MTSSGKQKTIRDDPSDIAKSAGLVYTTDTQNGITRIRNGKGFEYKNAQGDKVTDEKTLSRIKSLVIPPAWENVWISKSPNSHLQATGYDARGRKQYKYHSDWTSRRNDTKFGRLYLFGKSLSKIRGKNRENLKLRGMPKEKALAVVISVMDKVFIRVGNREYEKSNGTYGLTTLRDKHVSFENGKAEFKFKAKSGKESDITLEDKLLSKLVKKCKDIPGYHLFQYYNEDGEHVEIHSHDVNEYLKNITGENFTAKDFRTWAGTVNAYSILKDCVECKTGRDKKKAIVDCVKKVAQKLNNTVAICKKYYIHPGILNKFEEGFLPGTNGKSYKGLDSDETAVLKILSEM
jgi:DNA topoisomerase I